MGKSAEEIALPYAVKIAEVFLAAMETGEKLEQPIMPIIAAAIREDRAEPVSESEVEAGARAIAVNSGKDPDKIIINEGNRATWTFYSHIVRLALQAARQARATADEKGGAR